jgi:hypothetical protein
MPPTTADRVSLADLDAYRVADVTNDVEGGAQR